MPDRDKIKAATAKIFQDMASAMAVGMVYVGVRTGLFRVMAGGGAMSAAEVAAAGGLQQRYVEEWLNGMTACGYLHYDAARESFTLAEEYAHLLAADDSDHFAGGLFYMAPPLLSAAPKVAEAFTTGGGVHFGEFGEAGADALDLINRGNYRHRFAQYWLKALPEVTAQLAAGARALDFGCGAGQVSIALARAFPASTFHGVERDAASLARARRGAAEAGVERRVEFFPGLAALGDGTYQLLTICDCVHDLARPVAALGEARRKLAAGGTLFVVEPKAGDSLADNCNPVGAMFYGFSLFHCMTQSLAEGGPGFGTCMGPARLEKLLGEAGFRDFRQLDIKSGVNNFYAAAR